MKKRKVVITGGAGYIGSHTLEVFKSRSWDTIVVDNLSYGYREFVRGVPLIEADIHDEERLIEIFKEFQPCAVIHFAAFIQAEESVKKPLMYYHNNVAGSISLLKAMLKAGVRLFVFSSSAAVYGNVEKVPIPETAPVKPVNPYGETKAVVEKILRDLSDAGELRYVSLRYFNAAGAHPEGTLGEMHNPETHLIPLLLKTAKGELKKFTIYRSPSPTRDGTCIRDFIHVMDLAEAHVLALEYLLEGGKSTVLNCGYGRGYSVKEIVELVKKITRKDFAVEEAPPRPGDPPVLIADPSLIKKTLSWRPKFDDIEFIIRTAWKWEQKIPLRKNV